MEMCQDARTSLPVTHRRTDCCKCMHRKGNTIVKSNEKIRISQPSPIVWGLPGGTPLDSCCHRALRTPREEVDGKFVEATGLCRRHEDPSLTNPKPIRIRNLSPIGLNQHPRSPRARRPCSPKAKLLADLGLGD